MNHLLHHHQQVQADPARLSLEVSLLWRGPPGWTEQRTHHRHGAPGSSAGPLCSLQVSGRLRGLWLEGVCWKGDVSTTPSRSPTKETATGTY